MMVGFARVMWPQMWHWWPAVFSGSKCQFTADCESIDMTVKAGKSSTCTLLLFHWEHVPITVWRRVMRLQTVLAVSRSFPLCRWSLYLPVSENEAGVRDWKWREEECDLGAEELFHSFVQKKTMRPDGRWQTVYPSRWPWDRCLWPSFIHHQMLSGEVKTWTIMKSGKRLCYKTQGNWKTTVLWTGSEQHMHAFSFWF